MSEATVHSSTSSPKKRTKKVVLVFLFVLLNVGIIAYTALKEFGGEKPEFDFSHFRLEYLLYAVAAFLLTLLCKMVVYGTLLKKTTGAFHPRISFNTAVIGRYYDYITPLGAGGQPFQVWYLAKERISGGIAAMLPIIALILDHLAFVAVGLAAVFLYPGSDLETVLHVGIYVGMAMYLFIPLVLVLFSVFPRPIRFLVEAVAGLIAKIRPKTDKKAISEKFIHSLEEYRESMRIVRGSVGTLLITFLFSILHYVLLVSLPYLSFRMLGVEAGYLEITTTTVFVYLSVAAIPTPGNAGASEGLFYSVLSDVSPGNTFLAMMIWRIFSYYLYLAAGGLYYLGRLFCRKKLKE